MIHKYDQLLGCDFSENFASQIKAIFVLIMELNTTLYYTYKFIKMLDLALFITFAYVCLCLRI